MLERKGPSNMAVVNLQGVKPQLGMYSLGGHSKTTWTIFWVFFDHLSHNT